MNREGRIGEAQATEDLIVDTSPAMQDVWRRIRRVSRTRSTVLITGESGTGKELVARTIHAQSARCRSRFVAVNCAAIPESLAEAELLGAERGSFTGAVRTRPGWFEQADRGTLFLDEIGDMPLSLQAKLLRVLQEREVQRLGGDRTIPVDVRVIAATNRDLLSAIQDGTFRDDLYYRLAVITIRIPPLREWTNLDKLVQHFVVRHATQAGVPTPRVSGAARERLRSHHWPGNVRQLSNVVEYAVVMCDGIIEPNDIDDALDAWPTANHHATDSHASEPSKYDGQTLEEVERNTIRAALVRTGGNQAEAARRLGIGRNTITRKMQRYGIAKVLT